MNKKYCIFSAQYLPSMGGVERYTYYIAKKMVENGDNVTIVTSGIKGKPQITKEEGIDIYRLPCFPLMNGRLPILKLNSTLRKFMRELDKKQFDMVIVNTRFYIHSLYGVRYAKKRKIKSITIEHGTSHLTFNNKVLDVFEKIYEHGITCLVKKYCKNFYGVSEASCEWSGHFNIKSKGTLYNAVDVKEINEIYENTSIDYRKKYNIPKEDIVISYTGRMIKEKGIIQLLEAVRKCKSDKKLHLIYAGEGPLEEYISQCGQKYMENNECHNVITLGRIDFKHIVALLKASDIFCLPSDSEGFPTSVLEAVAAKCFVITTENGGAKELITDDSLGIIIPNNNVDTIVTGISKALSDDEYRRLAVSKAYKTLEEKFTFDVLYKKIDKISNLN